MKIFDSKKQSTKNRLKFVLRFIFICLFIVVITLCGKVFETISNTLDGLWVQYKSPYDLHDEFIINKLLTAHRDEIHYLTFGFADEWAKEKHKSIVEQVKNKINAGDDVWIEYWYDSEAIFWPHNDKEHALERIPLALKYMDMLMTGDSKILQFNKAWRYKIWTELSYYVVHNTYQSTYNYDKKYTIINKLIKDSNVMYQKLDVEYLLKKNNIEIILPFRMLSDRQVLYGYMIQMQKNYNKFICSSSIITDFRDNVAQIINRAATYNDIIPRITERTKQEICRVIEDDIKRVRRAQEVIDSNCPIRKDL